MSPSPPRAVLIWLTLVYVLIGCMVAVGGITRLTGSGLSMTEWHPLMGWLPPLTDDAWHHVFSRYQQSPQYLDVNHWMTLSQFKQIFFWEYIHRLLGRSIGLVFLLPWLVFVFKRSLQGAWIWRTGLAFVLGGAQGLLGWFMVQSGLVDLPEVSHYRLAAHLSLAFVLGAYILWLILDIRWPKQTPTPHPLYYGGLGLLSLLALQTVYGAFMAGKKAGLLYSSFPDFFGRAFPSEAFDLAPLWLNFLDNGAMIHGLHRWLGLALALSAMTLTIAVCRTPITPRAHRLAGVLLLTVLGQLTLGALTVIYSVPLWTAVAHQVVGFILVSVTVALLHALRRPV
jgi:cytochrome c oxidase assembly protein subunit 15